MAQSKSSKALLYLLGGLALWEAAIWLADLRRRREAYAEARIFSDQVSKPLLVVGAPLFGFSHPCGDVTIDLNPQRLRFCPTGGQVADVRAIPYPDKYFGAAHCSHVLEHLHTVEDAERALSELNRVADKVWVVSPSKLSLIAWIYAQHHLWVTEKDGHFIIEQR